ncbi:MAG: flagellar biosynthesis protein FlhB [Armatimonadota bacterium]
MFSEERTEQATPRKRQDAREKGQVAKSMEISATLGLLASLLAFKWFGPALVTAWQSFSVAHLRHLGHEPQLTGAVVQTTFLQAGGSFLRMILPMLLFVLAAGVASNVLQTGFVFSTKTLAFDFARLNPLQGIKRMLSQRAAVDLFKAMAKAGVLGYMVYSFFRNRGDEITRLACLPYTQLGPNLVDLCLDLLIKATCVMLVIAALDYFFQRYQFEKSLRMTKQEVKEEYKRTEGDPQVKGQIRRRQREAAQRRMMADVPKATVVITNPTHIAIALRYEPGKMAAPQVLAMGQLLIAQKIKEIAAKHRIPVVENKPLARALFAACEVGDVIPVEFYEAVAEVIAFVFKSTGRSAAKGSD